MFAVLDSFFYLFSSQLVVGLNAWCKIKRTSNDGGISQLGLGFLQKSIQVRPG